jgi:hypothetical protein
MSLSGNPDNNLESQYPCKHVFGLQSDCKLLSGSGGTYELPCISELFRLYQQPRCPGHELSSLSRKLGSCVRIPLKAWIFGVCMRLFCVCVLWLGRGLATS